MHFINQEFFAMTHELIQKNTVSVSLYATATPEHVNNKITELKKTSNPFINMRAEADEVDDKLGCKPIEVHAYHHVNKGRDVCWTTTGEKYGPWDELHGISDTYFVAIPYKQSISNIRCSDGVEVLKASTRSYGKIWEKHGTFDWRDPSKKYPKDSSEGLNYNKVLYLIVNVKRGVKDPNIEITEVNIPSYAIKKTCERGVKDAVFHIKTHMICLHFADKVNTAWSNTPFYPSGKFITVDYSLGDVCKLEERTKSGVMGLITPAPANK